VTVNDAFAVFALESVASHVTRVLRSWKRLPDLGWHRTVTTPSVSSWAVSGLRSGRRPLRYRAGRVPDCAHASPATRHTKLPCATACRPQAAPLARLPARGRARGVRPARGRRAVHRRGGVCAALMSARDGKGVVIARRW